jgi:hypothetical protein
MSQLDISELNQPVNYNEFKLISKNKLPICLLGYEIKNLYDQKYLTIDKKYDPYDIVHISKYPTVQPTFIRGIPFAPNSHLLSLINKLNKTHNMSFGEISSRRYSQIVTSCKLECRYSLCSLRDGIYPVDGECMLNISNFKNMLFNLYNDMIKKTIVPCYLKLRYYKVLVLTDTSVNF